MMNETFCDTSYEQCKSCQWQNLVEELPPCIDCHQGNNWEPKDPISIDTKQKRIKQ